MKQIIVLAAFLAIGAATSAAAAELVTFDPSLFAGSN